MSVPLKSDSDLYIEENNRALDLSVLLNLYDKKEKKELKVKKYSLFIFLSIESLSKCE